MRNAWETPPTVEGVVVRAWIGQDGTPDVMHVHGIDVADDVGNLDRVIGDSDNPDPNRPFSLIGMPGTIAQHGYTDSDKLIGKRCLIHSGGPFDTVAIEPEQGDHWGLVVWCEYRNWRSVGSRERWMQQKAAESLSDPAPSVSHAQVMTDAQALVDAKPKKHTGKTAS